MRKPVKPKINGRILLLSQSLPPKISGMSTVVQNLASQFSPDEMIVAGANLYEPHEVTWDDSWAELHYLIKRWPVTRRGRDKWIIIQFPLILARTLQLAVQKKCDVIIANIPFAEFIFISYLVALCTGARFFPYFHNTLEDNYSGFDLLFAKWLQQRIFSRAESVFVISEGLAEYYRSHYKGIEFYVLPHSFPGSISTVPPVPNSQSALRLAILGTIGESNLDAVKRVCEAVSRIPDCTLDFYSGTLSSYFDQHGLLGDRIKHSTPSQSELYKLLREADILILPHGFKGGYSDVEYQTIFPTRTIDYLIAGRPILAHCPPDCYLTRFLKQHNCALIVEQPDISALVDAIKRLQSDKILQVKIIENALKISTSFQASYVAKKLRDKLAQRT